MKRLRLPLILLVLLFGIADCSPGNSAQVAPAHSVGISPLPLQDRTHSESSTAPPGEVAPAAESPGLGTLSPTLNLLPSGTISITLALTTTVPARCRWSENAGTRYSLMPNDFQQGEETTAHSTIVTGLRDLDDRYFHVRCQDLAGDRDPDADESRTHLRVLGPWDGGYPRITHLWGEAEPSLGAAFYARYELLIPYTWSGQADLLDAIRRASPSTKILHYQYGTKANPDRDALSAEWWNSRPGEPGYICLLRDSTGDILLVDGYRQPMSNMTQPSCREALVRNNIAIFLSSTPDQGDNLAYDGIYWDHLGDDISWLGNDIDSDLDGRPDVPEILDAAHEAGVEDFLAQMRAGLPYALLLGNGSAPEYALSINGRFYETTLSSVLDSASQTWEDVVAKYRDWARRGHIPHITTLFGAPEAIYQDKHSSQLEPHILPAFQEEAAADYGRMRFGLTSALMGDGLFYHDLRGAGGSLVWYDEFGAPGNDLATTLPPRGYLGQPVGDPMPLDDMLDARPAGVWARPFENGLAVINTTREVQTAPLPGDYCKLRGSQAPLFQVRVDDDEAQASPGWINAAADRQQFGATVHVASGGSEAAVAYIPVLACGGEYEVLAWVAPNATQSKTVSVSIRHVHGETMVSLDETIGDVGWHSLGRYTFSEDGAGRATLTAAGNGEVVADAFKWVSTARYNDGSKVSQVTLQPQDGIVLLTSCIGPLNRVHLPLAVHE